MTAPLSPREAQIVARFDEAEAAPESFDAVEAMRRVEALCRFWDSYTADDNSAWRLFRHVAHEIRLVSRGES